MVPHLCPQSVPIWCILSEGWVGEWVKGSQETDETVGQVKWLPQFVSACTTWFCCDSDPVLGEAITIDSPLVYLSQLAHMAVNKSAWPFRDV